MKPAILPLSLLLILAVLISCSKNAPVSNAEKTLYTCGMHPQIIQDHPGNCPICGMKLTPIRKQPPIDSAQQNPNPGQRKIKYYKSTMMAGEIRQTPGKDSMGMDMVSVYEGDETGATTISVDAMTIQKMNVRTGGRPAGWTIGSGHSQSQHP
jgi:hypothetical protein